MLKILTMENLEIWRKVEEAPQYEISNKNGWRNTTRMTQPKGGYQSKGYRFVSLGKGKSHALYHILVAKAFPEICGKWFDGCQVHHINFNRLDNRPENLIILTPSEHSKLHYEQQPDSFKKPSEKRSKSISNSLRGKPRPFKHVPIIQYDLNGNFVKEWDYLSECKEYGYSQGNVCSCCKGRLKQYKGFIWRYK